MIVRLNGDPTDVPEGATVADALALLAVEPAARGVAVAVDAEVVPRREWGARALAAGAHVEVLTAIQGG